MDVAVYKKLTDIENDKPGWENPFGTPRGQIVASESESWKVRASRLGQMKSITSPSGGVLTSQGGIAQIVSAGVTPGYYGIVSKATISANGSGVAFINYTRQNGGTAETYMKYIPANGSFDMDFNGEATAGDNCQIALYFKADNTNTTAWGSIIYAEVLI